MPHTQSDTKIPKTHPSRVRSIHMLCFSENDIKLKLTCVCLGIKRDQPEHITMPFLKTMGRDVFVYVHHQ